MNQTMKYPLVRVVWKDIVTIVGNVTLDELRIKKLPLMENVGYLLLKDKDKVVLLSQVQLTEDGIGQETKDGNDATIIPVGVIVKLEKITICLPKRLKKIVNKIQ